MLPVSLSFFSFLFFSLSDFFIFQEISVENGVITTTREVDEGVETISAPLPAVVTADLRLNEPRFASLPNIMKARKSDHFLFLKFVLMIFSSHRKPIQEFTPEKLNVDLSPRVVTLRFLSFHSFH